MEKLRVPPLDPPLGRSWYPGRLSRTSSSLFHFVRFFELNSIQLHFNRRECYRVLDPVHLNHKFMCPD